MGDTRRLVFAYPLDINFVLQGVKKAGGQPRNNENLALPAGPQPATHRELNKPFGGAPTHSDELSMAWSLCVII